MGKKHVLYQIEKFELNQFCYSPIEKNKLKTRKFDYYLAFYIYNLMVYRYCSILFQKKILDEKMFFILFYYGIVCNTL